MAGTKEGDSKREENRRKEGSLKMATKQKSFPSVFIVRHLPCKDASPVQREKPQSLSYNDSPNGQEEDEEIVFSSYSSPQAQKSTSGLPARSIHYSYSPTSNFISYPSFANLPAN